MGGRSGVTIFSHQNTFFDKATLFCHETLVLSYGFALFGEQKEKHPFYLEASLDDYKLLQVVAKKFPVLPDRKYRFKAVILDAEMKSKEIKVLCSRTIASPSCPAPDRWPFTEETIAMVFTKEANISFTLFPNGKYQSRYSNTEFGFFEVWGDLPTNDKFCVKLHPVYIRKDKFRKMTPFPTEGISRQEFALGPFSNADLTKEILSFGHHQSVGNMASVCKLWYNCLATTQRVPSNILFVETGRGTLLSE